MWIMSMNSLRKQGISVEPWQKPFIYSIYVDNVDNSLTQKLFPYFYYVSGPHSYQQIPVYTIF